MKNVFTILLFLLCYSCFAQKLSPEQLGFESYELKNADLGTINYYLNIDEGDEKKPLIVYLDGSGANPLFQETERGIASTVVFNYPELAKDYRLLLISKPGVPFMDKVVSDERGYPMYPEPKTYTERLSLEWRVESANLIVEQLIQQEKIDANKIILFGFSEGAQVAPFLAELNQNITHVLLFGGNGLNQFFDPIISTRLKSQSGQISEQEAQTTIDSLFEVYEDIYKNPDLVDKKWWGHTYKRWSSFTNRDPLDALLTLDIPIYIANGSLDENSVLSADYIKLEFLNQQKKNLFYKTYPNYDHQFNELIFEGSQFKEAIPQLDLVLGEAFKWLKSQ